MAAVTLGLRTFFLGGALFGPAMTIVPAWRARYFDYGTRSAPPAAAATRADASAAPHDARRAPQDSQTPKGWNPLAAPVPHGWFVHFYLLCAGLAAFWLQQLVARGPAVRFLAGGGSGGEPLGGPLPTRSQVLLTTGLLLAQGLRRLAECVFVLRPSAATMPGMIYLAGLAYYAAVSVAVWIDGAAAALAPPSPTAPTLATTLQTPSVALGVAIFAAGSMLQAAAHAHLASLVKYTPPQRAGRSGVPGAHLLFRHLVCPHYTAEVLVYVGLALVGAPAGRALGSTLATVVAFVIGGLGAVSAGTREWERARFGEASVKGRWRMLPGIW